MKDEERELILEAVRQSVRETVNGKIDRIQNSLDEYRNEQVLFGKRLLAIEEKLNPIWETYSNLGGFRKTIMSASILVGSLAGLGFGFVQILSWFKRI